MRSDVIGDFQEPYGAVLTEVVVADIAIAFDEIISSARGEVH